MKKLKDFLKKPVVRWCIGGSLGIVMGILISTNIGLKNQNNDLFSKYSKTGNLYINLVTKYQKLRKDSLDIAMQHLWEVVFLKKDNLKLVNRLDSLQENYIHFVENSNKAYLELDSSRDSLQSDYIIFAENALEKTKDKRDILEQMVNIAQEREFYKKYVHYLDSLLFKCESSKALEGQ